MDEHHDPPFGRRGFVRLVGGGVIVAAGGLGAGCSRQLPPEAIEAWKGPSATEPDVRRWILAHAILAPHSHNLQSWLIDLRTPGEMLLRCDLERLLPATDPFSRQIMMSHGTFLELLDIAARERGLRADITLFPEGAFGPGKIDARPVARIRLAADPAVVKDALFAQILARRTNRNAYEPTRAVPTEARQAMADAAAPHGVRFGFVGAEPAALQRHREIASEAWRIELTTPRTIMESYRVLRVGAAEVAKHRDGLTVMDPKLVWMDRLGLFDRSRAPAPDSYATTSQIQDFNARLASTASFLWIVSTGNDRLTQVNAGRAYARVQLAGTAHGVVMQPLSQALQEYPEQAGPYAAIHGLLDAPTRTQTVQMWARVGFAPPVEPAPRRGLDDYITGT
jgi:hypothetical protein